VSPLDRDAPPAGEEIHLPGPSILPVLLAAGLALTLVGLTTFIELTVIGGLLSIGCVVRWIKDTRREVDELPLDAP
jgi:hypothetical protein